MPDEDWLHLDQGAQKQGLHAFQGAVYLEETTDTDYCFRVLENSHNYNSSFLEKFPRVADISTKTGIDLIDLNETQKEWFKSKGCTQIKVPCPKGGMILWDSRTVHDNCKPEFGRPNKDRWRFVVFVSMTPAIWAKPHDIEKKQEAYEKLLQTSHWSSQGVKLFRRFYDYMKRGEKDLVIEELPEIAKTREVRLLFGVDAYDFDDGQPNGPPEPQWTIPDYMR